VLGGSGNSEAIVANRVRGVRCVICWSLDTAGWSLEHYDANLIGLGGGRLLERIWQIEPPS